MKIVQFFIFVLFSQSALAMEEVEEGLSPEMQSFINLCQSALKNKDLESLQQILKAHNHQTQNDGQPKETDNLIKKTLQKPISSLDRDAQFQILDALYRQLQIQKQQHLDAMALCSKHINMRTLSAAAMFLIAAGGYYGNFAEQCRNDDAPWYCDVLKTAAATFLGAGGMYQVGHHINETDSNQNYNALLAMEQQMGTLLESHGFSTQLLLEAAKNVRTSQN